MDSTRYIVKHTALSDNESAYIIPEAGDENEYRNSKVSDWFEHGAITVPSHNGYDVMIRFNPQHDIDTLLLQHGFVFDNDRIHVSRV